MTIIRRDRRLESGFYILDRSIAEDTDLSLEARGLLISLLVKPDDWEVSVTALRKREKVGRDKLYRMLREIEDAGYLSRRPIRDEAGKVQRFDYVIHETPQPLPENPEVDESTTSGLAGNGSAGNGYQDTTKKPRSTKEEKGNKEPCVREGQLVFSSWPGAVRREVIRDYVKHRRGIKAPLTQTAVDRLGTELHRIEDAGLDVNEALGEAMVANWRGIKLDWVRRRMEGDGQEKQQVGGWI